MTISKPLPGWWLGTQKEARVEIEATAVLPEPS
jgi:hypothetical protein